MRTVLAAALITVLGASPSVLAQSADQFQAGLRATLTLSDLEGGMLSKVQAGEQFSLDLDLVDAATGSAPKGLTVEGWIRPVEQSNLRCLEAARAFRATRRLPTGSVDLNGIMLATFNTDGSWGLADPNLSLATANMRAAGKFARPPDFVATERATQSLLIGSTSNGRIDRLTMDGHTETVVGKMAAPIAAIATDEGKIWTAESGNGAVTLRERSGSILFKETLAGVAGIAGGDRIPLVAWSESEIAVIDPPRGSLRTPVKGSGKIADLAVIPLGGLERPEGFVISYLPRTGNELALIFGDDLSATSFVHLAAEATHVAPSPDGKYVYAWNPKGGVSIIDLASSSLVTGLAIQRGISDVEFTRDAVFFVTGDQSSVLTLDVSTIARGKSPALRNVRLGPESDASFAGRDLLISLSPSPQVLAVHADTYTGFVIDEKSAIGDAPPMNAFRLRGGNPAVVRVIDRSFRQVEPGHFRTQASLPAGGAYELVITTGIGGMSQCFSLTATGAARERAQPVAYRMEIQGADRLRAGARSDIALNLFDENNQQVSLKAPVAEARSLEFGWKAHRPEAVLNGATIRLALTFPTPGHYSIQVRDEASGGRVLAAQVLEVTR